MSAWDFSTIMNFGIGIGAIAAPAFIENHFFSTMLFGENMVATIGKATLALSVTSLGAAMATPSTRKSAINALVFTHSLVLAGQLVQKFVMNAPVPALPIVFAAGTLVPLVLASNKIVPSDLVVKLLSVALSARSIFFTIFPAVVAHNLFASSITAIELKKSLFLTIGFIFLGAGYLGLQLREDINRAKVAPYAAAASAATAVAFIAFPPVSLPLAVAFAAQAVAFAFNM